MKSPSFRLRGILSTFECPLRSAAGSRETNMLVIRRLQQQALEEARRLSLARPICDEVRSSWPERCRSLSDERLLAIVQDGIRRAGVFGLTRDRQVKRFLNLMFAVGFDFDRDPAYPEASAWLNARGVAAEVRLERVCDWARTVLQARRRETTE